MKRLILFSVILLLLPSFVLAHPGKTTSDGCHYCRSNCDKWDVPWNKRHCHNRGSEVLPISKIKAKGKGNDIDKTKAAGWEYGLGIKKTSGLINKIRKWY